MNKVTLSLLLLLILFVGVIALLLFPGKAKNTLTSPFANSTTQKKVQPSEILKEYSDPTGFTFSYPDNLSIESKEIEDTSTYADIQLNSKDVSGSLNLNISDSKYKSLDEWVKKNTASNQTPKEVRLGNLKALELKLNDRLLLGALDQGILFTIEMPLIEQDFWMKVYTQVVKDFSFNSPTATTSSQSGPTNDVSFEGEETVE